MRQLMQIKVTLEGTALPVWRRILVPAHFTLRKAHGVLVEAMGWEGGGPYHFFQDGRLFANPALHSDYVEDDAQFRLRYCLCLPGQSVGYAFGPWKHLIVLEAVTPAEAPGWRLVAGEGTCPPAAARSALSLTVH
jgi:hypothetical protein